MNQRSETIAHKLRASFEIVIFEILVATLIVDGRFIVLMSRTTMNSLPRRLLHVVAMFSLAAPVTAQADQIYYMHTDHLNTPTVVTNQNKIVVWEGVKRPFGETQETVATVRQPLRFPGQYHDQETGLSYNMMRDYDPRTGRYIEADAHGIDYGVDLYGYVGQDPILRDDPTGEYWQLPIAFCLKFPKICASIENCGKNPAACRNAFCRAGNRLYHPMCDFKGCKEGEDCATTSMKLSLAEGCYANRLAVSWLCNKQTDPNHEREKAIAWQKGQDCLRLLPINCKDCGVK